MFNDYFNYSEEYPNPTTRMLPVNCEYTYISNTFLNGFINYVNIIKAFLITRYEPYSKNLESAVNFHDREKNKFHTKIYNFFDDDVAILAVSDIGEYWYFYYDQDCSDCSIGRFRTDDSEEKVILKFKLFCNNLDVKYNYEENSERKEAIELNPMMFHKWMSS